jgi:hypothetical protein
VTPPVTLIWTCKCWFVLSSQEWSGTILIIGQTIWFHIYKRNDKRNQPRTCLAHWFPWEVAKWGTISSLHHQQLGFQCCGKYNWVQWTNFPKKPNLLYLGKMNTFHSAGKWASNSAWEKYNEPINPNFPNCIIFCHLQPSNFFFFFF